MVVTAHPLATHAAVDMLKEGGNAVDAAVTAAFCLGVVEGYYSGIGGGSFILYRRNRDRLALVIDARERAPSGAGPKMYYRNGQADRYLSRSGPLAAGVPGTVAGLTELLSEAGTVSLARALAPAIELAAVGFPIGLRYSRLIERERESFNRFPSTREIFFPKGTAPVPGSLFKQPDLAGSLKAIAEEGAKAFYEDEIADAVVRCMEREGGLISASDLMNYKTRRPQAVLGNYRGMEIITMPPPSSGGIALVQILNILEGYDLAALGHNSAGYIQLVAEAMKAAYFDRASFLADDAFFKVPRGGLTAKDYAAAWRERIAKGRAVEPERPADPSVFGDGRHTTHLSVVDSELNAVSITQTINGVFGSRLVVPGTGILLNNEMDDFNIRGDTPETEGNPTGIVNRVEPGKAPLSSMTPTLVLREGVPFLVLGSPGGTRIITTVLQVLLNVVDFRMDIQAAVSAPRFHHQWAPDTLYVEEQIGPETVAGLEGMGYHTARRSCWSNSQSILYDPEEKLLFGGSDPRGIGRAASPDGMDY
jgi:gamma-glutamyltranspeptidase/glutathione hydrolase